MESCDSQIFDVVEEDVVDTNIYPTSFKVHFVKAVEDNLGGSVNAEPGDELITQGTVDVLDQSNAALIPRDKIMGLNDPPSETEDIGAVDIMDDFYMGMFVGQEEVVSLEKDSSVGDADLDSEILPIPLACSDDSNGAQKVMDSESDYVATVKNEDCTVEPKEEIALGTVTVPLSTFLDDLSNIDASSVTNGFILDLFNHLKNTKCFTWIDVQNALSFAFPSLSQTSVPTFYNGCMQVKNKRTSILKKCDKSTLDNFLADQFSPPRFRPKKKQDSESLVSKNLKLASELQKLSEECTFLLDENSRLQEQCDKVTGENNELRSLIKATGYPAKISRTLKRKDASIALWKKKYQELNKS
uniref:Transcriptional activator Zfx/Zfy domain-containing protein n=1 Tax=Eptatretus burgeri TaxID=7764 RepID=A0A8C4N2L1_EPTBU